MPKIIAVAELATVTPIRKEAEFTLGKEGKHTHALIQVAGGYVTLCKRQPAKPDSRRSHNTRDDITCNRCRTSVNGMLEATA